MRLASVGRKDSMATCTLLTVLVALLLFLAASTSVVYVSASWTAPLDASEIPQFRPGESFTLTITCINSGQQQLSNVMITTDDPWIQASQHQQNLGSLQVGERKSMDITGVVPNDATPRSTHHITFTCSAPGVTLSTFSVDIGVAAQTVTTSTVIIPPEIIMAGGGIAGVAVIGLIIEWWRRYSRPPTLPPRVFADPAPNVPGRVFADPAPNVPGRVLADPAPNVPGRVFADPAPNVPGRVLADPAPNVPGRVFADPAPNVPNRVVVPGDRVWIKPGGQVWTPPQGNQVFTQGNVNVNQNPNMNINQNPVNVNTRTPVNVNVNVAQPPTMPQPGVTSVTPQPPISGQSSGLGVAGTVAATAAGVAAATGIGAVALARRATDKCVWCGSKVKGDELVCSRCGVHQECPRCGTPLYKTYVASKGYRANPQDQGLFCDRCNTFTA